MSENLQNMSADQIKQAVAEKMNSLRVLPQQDSPKRKSSGKAVTHEPDISCRFAR